ncbi:hypothetical protein PH213_17110 [Streptomyces sp. SRF1]|uniref:nSTAND3 domain-containing NTPase n=1 Tax=Streptomyces sp. SRF1 TaxID=1549642 RepID=UPI0025B26180|nr:hypothetical protein [Streptomyces sp. SRF1]MDN3056232.1 hypothetical protein [Streptomyces sp. SRF1]
MYRWECVSDRDAEIIVCDLLAGEWGVHVERFRSGRDGGVDLRVTGPCGPPLNLGANEVLIAQVKHYPVADLARIRAAFKKEAERGIVTTSVGYCAVTTASMSIKAKEEIANLFNPKLPSSRIFGREDLESFLGRNPRTEQRHYKLWIGNTANLQSVLNAKGVGRSKQLMRELARDCKYLVETRHTERARRILEAEGSVIIAGPPGVGKSSLAKMLIAENIASGWEPVVALNSIDEAEELLSEDRKQIVFYDDFLGASLRTAFLHGKNEDSRIIRMLEMAKERGNLRIVLTTREYILASAKLDHQRLQDISVDISRIIVDTADLTASERAEIVYRQIYFSDMVRVLSEGRAGEWLEVIGHKNFNPRLSFYFIERASRSKQESSGLSNAALARGLVSSFDEPLELWRAIYDDQLSDVQRRLLQVLCSFELRCVLDDLVELTANYCTELGEGANPHSIRRAIRAIDGDFVEIATLRDGSLIYFSNPSIGDYVSLRLASDIDSMLALLAQTVSFSQVQVLWRLMRASMANCWESVEPDDGERTLDQLAASRRSLGEHERSLLTIAFRDAMLRLIPVGIYSNHPAYGAKSGRWKFASPGSLDGKVVTICDLVVACGLEHDETIPSGISQFLSKAMFSTRSGILAMLDSMSALIHFDGWRNLFWECLVELEGKFYERLDDAYDFADAHDFLSRYGEETPDILSRLRKQLVLVADQLASRAEEDADSFHGMLPGQIAALEGAGQWLQVDVTEPSRRLRTVASNLPDAQSPESVLLDEEYSTAPLRLNPARMSGADVAEAVRILGC